MPEPTTLAAVGVMALAQGVKFLYTEAAEALKLWRAKKEKEIDRTEPPPLASAPRPVPPVFAGEVVAGAPDLAAVAKVEAPLAAARKDVADLAEGLEDVDPKDPAQLEKIDALRRLVEAAYGRRITFEGEKRAPSGPLVRGEVDVEELLGYAAGVRAKHVKGGRVEGAAKAKKVGAGGELSGVDVEDVG
jgi:hypothetical protein